MTSILGRALRGIGFVMPWLIRVAWTAIKTMVLSLVSLWRGIPASIQEIADEWVGNAAIAGFPTEYDRWLFIGAQAVAFMVIVIGWVLCALLIVWLLGLIF